MSERTADDVVPYKLILTYDISYKFYHELNSVVKELPQSHKIYKKLLATPGNVTYIMQMYISYVGRTIQERPSLCQGYQRHLVNLKVHNSVLKTVRIKTGGRGA